MTYMLEELPAVIRRIEAEISTLRQRVEMLEGQTPDLVSVEEAAALLDVHANTIKKWIRAGKLPATKPGAGRNWKIARADVLALIEAK